MTSWMQRVTEKMRKIQRQERDDAQTFQSLCDHLDSSEAIRDGETLEIDGAVATKTYKDRVVFSFHMHEGRIVVTPVGQKAEDFDNFEQAIDRMAEFMALAVHRPAQAPSIRETNLDIKVRKAPAPPLYPA